MLTYFIYKIFEQVFDPPLLGDDKIWLKYHWMHEDNVANSKKKKQEYKEYLKSKYPAKPSTSISSIYLLLFIGVCIGIFIYSLSLK